MIASSYYEKALSKFKSAKTLFLHAEGDEEQLNTIGFLLQQSLELAIKHILGANGVPLQKTHNLDQLIKCASDNGVNLYLTPYLLERSDVISIWEEKTRYVMGFSIEVSRISNTIDEMDKYFSILSKKLTY